METQQYQGTCDRCGDGKRREQYKVSIGQSVCGGSIDLHPDGQGRWVVSGALEFARREDAETAARVHGRGAYAYKIGEWAPPLGAERLSLYSHR